LILRHRQNFERNFDWLLFTPLWSPSPVLHTPTYSKEASDFG
jgi:hypothetical protein